jgi:hypothetical protein
MQICCEIVQLAKALMGAFGLVMLELDRKFDVFDAMKLCL